ncbi:hypothetical protein RvY_04047 [Ramazzottius varieornatus]|uniref:Receptor ligand binding region domain-containing protein n=1 Tax=Ramazzottius varieornatus TaxID=947166 RepID=A0A1D1UTN4_RAMVA|nr:hypothetical protein RvY_04047 [Ramazzottius varieornatus]
MSAEMIMRIMCPVFGYVFVLLLTLIPTSFGEPFVKSDTNTTGALSDVSKPRLHFLIVIAYFIHFVLPAIDVAINDARSFYPKIDFTYTAISNPDDPSCERFEGLAGYYLANYYYTFEKAPEVYVVVFATGRFTEADRCRTIYFWNPLFGVQRSYGGNANDKTRTDLVELPLQYAAMA